MADIAGGEKRLIVTISGERSPDGLPKILEAVERSRAVLTDLQQFVVQDEFTLTIVIDLHSAEGPRETDIVKELLLCAHAMKFHAEFDVVQKKPSPAPGKVFVITMISPVVSATAFLVDICHVITQYNGNIETINSLSKGVDGIISYEFYVRLPEANLPSQLQKLREGLLLLGKKARGDIAVQRAGLVQRAKRMVVFDLSYTLITSDANEIFFQAAGCEDATESDGKQAKAAACGEEEYIKHLEERVVKLRGMKASDVQERTESQLQFTNGAFEVVRVLKRLGYKTAVISRGPQMIAEAVKNKLGMDFAYGNEFVVEHGLFTGMVRTPAVDANRKAHLLHMLVMHENITHDQVIAVGDGPVSSKMLSHAGLAVAFDQPEASDGPVFGRINSRSLSSVLYLLGISQKDIKSMELAES